MVFDQTVSSRQATGRLLCAAAVLALAGCSTLHRHTVTAPAPSAAPAPAAASEEPPVAAASTPTITEAEGPSGDEPVAGATTTVVTDASANLSATAPRSYVVKRGDTLWGIASMFLKNPWLWPEIWYVNPQVRNPHRIYPGDTLQLAKGAGGQTQIQLVRGPGVHLTPMVRSQELGDNGPVATVPESAIRAFLSRPGVISREEVKAAPYLVALRDRHVIAGADDVVYARNLRANVGERYNIMHVDEKLRDPDGGATIGYTAIYAGTAIVTASGETTKLRVSTAAREVLVGDVLVPDDSATPVAIVPHAPGHAVDGQIISIVGGVLLVGQFETVAINRGTRHGVEAGTVLRVRDAGSRAADRCAYINGSGTCAHFKSVPLPAENVGTVLVFKSLERVSFGLVLGEQEPIEINERVTNP